jgi:hypothetical protein
MVLQFSNKRPHLALDETPHFPAKLEIVERVRDVPFDQASRETSSPTFAVRWFCGREVVQNQ